MRAFLSRVRRIPLSVVIAASALPFAGGCFLPPAANVQDARMVGQGNVRAAGFWSGLNGTEEDEKAADEFGALLGVGLGEKSELQLRVERIDLADEDDGYQFMSLGPKFGLVEDQLALLVPFGFYFGEDIEMADTFQIQPAILGTIPVSQAFEVNASGRVALPFDSDLFTWAIFGFGVGFSPDLDRWAILPEISYSIALDEEDADSYFGYGLALTIRTGD